MASEQLVGDRSQSLIASSPLFSHKGGAHGLGDRRWDSPALGLLRESSSDSMLGDGHLHRRKSMPKPRLPSFKGLGISSFASQHADTRRVEGTSSSSIERRISEHSCQRPTATPSPHLPRRTGSTPLLTPPADLDSLRWSISATDCISIPRSGSHSALQTPADRHALRGGWTSLSENGAAAEPTSLEDSGTSGGDTQQEAANTGPTQSLRGGNGPRSWLDQSVGATGQCNLDATLRFKILT